MCQPGILVVDLQGRYRSCRSSAVADSTWPVHADRECSACGLPGTVTLRDCKYPSEPRCHPPEGMRRRPIPTGSSSSPIRCCGSIRPPRARRAADPILSDKASFECRRHLHQPVPLRRAGHRDASRPYHAVGAVAEDPSLNGKIWVESLFIQEPRGHGGSRSCRRDVASTLINPLQDNFDELARYSAMCATSLFAIPEIERTTAHQAYPTKGRYQQGRYALAFDGNKLTHWSSDLGAWRRCHSLLGGTLRTARIRSCQRPYSNGS